MDKFWAFLKSHIWFFLIGVVGVLFAVAGVPLLINWAFSAPAICDCFAVDWEASDALAYYSSALGFIGTVIFSGLALWQNHIIKTESDKHTQLLEQMERKKNMPQIHVLGGGCGKDCEKLSFNVYNISDNIALDIVVSKVSILNKDGSEFWASENERRVHHLIESSFSVSLNNPPLTDIEQSLFFTISYRDKFEEQHTMAFEGRQVTKTFTVPRFSGTEISV